MTSFTPMATGSSPVGFGRLWVADASDLDVAFELAAEGAKAGRGQVGVRPFDGRA